MSASASSAPSPSSTIMSSAEDGCKGTQKKILTTHDDVPCGICLEKVEDRGIINCCDHRFCFECIEKWGKVGSNECPMCKKRFTMIESPKEKEGMEYTPALESASSTRKAQTCGSSRKQKRKRVREDAEERPDGVRNEETGKRSAKRRRVKVKYKNQNNGADRLRSLIESTGMPMGIFPGLLSLVMNSNNERIRFIVRHSSPSPARGSPARDSPSLSRSSPSSRRTRSYSVGDVPTRSETSSSQATVISVSFNPAPDASSSPRPGGSSGRIVMPAMALPLAMMMPRPDFFASLMQASETDDE